MAAQTFDVLLGTLCAPSNVNHQLEDRRCAAGVVPLVTKGDWQVG